MTKMEMIEKFYERNEELHERCEEAHKAQDKTGIDACQKAYQELLKEVRAQGADFSHMMRLYSGMKKRGNNWIDLNDVYREPETVIALFREFGVTEFTFSSTWSGATETAWAFTKLGCSLKGMTEIHGAGQDFMTGEYETVPAFLFTL